MVLSANTGIIVDTDVFSYWFKNDTRGKAFYQYTQGKRLYLTFITVGELYYWATKKNWGRHQIQQMENKIAEYAILPYDYSGCQYYAVTRNQKERKGEIVHHADYWVGACALSYDCPILTNNYSHFSRIKGIRLLGPSSN
jgi:tRNA(fMet)-specific endonuclease VapC